jgi:hypothetical protein
LSHFNHWLHQLTLPMMARNGSIIVDTVADFREWWDYTHPETPWESNPWITIIYFEKESKR